MEPFHIEDRDGVRVLSFPADTPLDETVAEPLTEVFQDLPAGTRILVDMGNVPYASSAVLGALVGQFRRVQDAGGDVRLCGLGEQLERVFHVTRLEQLFQIHDSVESGLNSYRWQAPGS